LDLSTDLTYVKGLGPARAEALAGKGLLTVADLLSYAPFRYEDRSNVKPIKLLAPGEMAVVVAVVRRGGLAAFRRRDLGLFEAVLDDGSGLALTAKWFKGGYLEKTLRPGTKVALFGKVEFDRGVMGYLMLHPEFEVLREDDPDAALHMGRIVPVYTAVGKVSARVLRSAMYRLLERLPEADDPLPGSVRQRLKLPGLTESWRGLHFPKAGTEKRLLDAYRTPEQFRLIFEELFWLECGIALKKRRARLEAGIAFALTEEIRERIKKMLPFRPTGAQKRVLGEIAKDMSEPRPMHRLLQGDVGSGKTLVAAEAAVIAMGNGYQVALLAPTEILATQHFFTFKRLLDKLGVVTTMLVGSQTPREKSQIKRLIAAGLVQVVVGTHALLEEDVEFDNLGLAIVDEQHRFGVMQRLKLSKKGQLPDVLVMTATPIPRTLALTIYGDLEVSVIDELPPGRQPIETRHVPEDQAELVYSFAEGQMAEGRQVYVVCPAIEENEAANLKAAQKEYAHLSERVFPKRRVGLLHGKLSTDEKERVMSAFQRGALDVLVSTTVIEVGVDVPNATVMIILGAERFGLAQLHQLRGRVGRGGHPSYCVLVTGKLSEPGRDRIRTLVESTDGFHIAEMDLKLRGPGEFFGTRQSGLPSLRIADIIRDAEVLEIARSEALAFVENEGGGEEMRRAVQYIQTHWQRRYGLVQVG
jgi:ATP-dependent DNA helicase RecG